ncbi:UDP-N-acetylmuramoyl-tripeptide--D-alanyl-D-alanine ligase [Sphingobacterium griseoflavum]|uniref:UDP-N-acetylmuramoyl-tripeptide--D-alanyl-D-alanine ligase n=1 Tax=Sphingobacterium griseoflavum TaxID=1474952 RepID=A0ABQ3HRJ0_9SPHI|nr:UDP-N-acetylmuramoyl-tripeptide--D-alanyl-D-alanine ligase [Sphingobacterium griseoflavum]GHE28463.1 UDP-N-acetylmuramoyl-tripeptide--D-alanyl-D-alanine ligase [Sphingobacterium griseoflavum]
MMTIAQLYQHYIKSRLIATDTRNIIPGSIFFALKGEKFNANAFAADAIAAGASLAVVDEDKYARDDRYILVADVLETLQDLARHHRHQLHIPVIGITGTNGKTTTKELLYAVLSQRYETFATKGNLNNHIGVPLSLLAIDERIEVAVIEMGANHQHEIAFLAEIAAPTHGLITNVGKAHLEGFGSFEGVKKAKGELYDYLKANHGVLFLQGDNQHLIEMERQRKVDKVVRYGFSDSNAVIGKLERANPFLQITWHLQQGVSHTVDTKLTGSYNTENILAAVAVGNFLGLADDEINRGINSYTPTNNRSQITKTSANTVIADYYNANASSMAAALANIAFIDAEQKAIILGDMFEMGDESFVEHQKLVEMACTIPAGRIIFVGKAFSEHKRDAAEFYETTDLAIQALRERPIMDSTVLLKASRGMAFEKLMEHL